MDTLLPLLTQGFISLIFGIIGGYVGSWIQYRFARRLEREREQRALREKLTKGVAEVMEQSQTAALSEIEVGNSRLEPLRRLLAPLAVLLLAVAAFALSTYAGIGAMFVVGLVVGGRMRV
jgi:NhaP-type Na+/H+ or K+/H+ antiporter